MNQQLIDSLLHKAGARFGAEGIDYSGFTASKFAELIVKECAGIYSKIDNGNLHMGTDDYLEALDKTFFGVE